MTAFVGGVTQFFVPSHLLAVVALGLLAGQQRAAPSACRARGVRDRT